MEIMSLIAFCILMRNPKLVFILRQYNSIIHTQFPLRSDYRKLPAYTTLAVMSVIIFTFRRRKNNNRSDPFILLHDLLRIRSFDQLALSYQAAQSSSKLPHKKSTHAWICLDILLLLPKLLYLNKKGTD
jgi:hypothetical protein